MDCEKYEPLLLDELYEELDELTSAAVKRHVSGCSRCASILNGMRGTRRLIALPLQPVPVGLEDRILSAAREAQKVVPIQSRFQRSLAWAGRWAMRPQTAMAAVFLLMIGSSAFFLRGRRDATRASSVSVTQEGTPEPVAQVAAADNTSLNTPAANTAHGAAQPVVVSPPAAAPSASAIALADPAAGPMDRLTGGVARDDKSGKDKADEAALGNSLVAKEGQGQGSAAGEKKKAEEKPSAATRGITNAGVPGGTNDLDYGGVQQAAPPPAAQTKTANTSQDGYSAGQAAYRARNYVEATRQFDQAAQTGDQNAALWAAKSVRDGNGGCSAALPRYESVAKKASGSWTGNQAELEAAQCQIAMGQLDPARTRLNKLAQVSTHAAQAQQALTELNQVASRREAEKNRAGGGGNASPRANPAPAPKAPDTTKASGF